MWSGPSLALCLFVLTHVEVSADEVMVDLELVFAVDVSSSIEATSSSSSDKATSRHFNLPSWWKRSAQVPTDK
jgi:hypothetical protein